MAVSKVSEGIAAALLAPLLEAVGFLEWDIHWSKAGGSAFALNMYKCNFAAFLFLCMAVFDSNSPYLRYTTEIVQYNNDPYGYTTSISREINNQMNPINFDPKIQDMMQEQQILEQQQMEQQALEQEQMEKQSQQQNFVQQQMEPQSSQAGHQVFIQQNPQNQNQRRLQMVGEVPVEPNEYLLMERRKKTLFNDLEQEGTRIDSKEQINETFQQRLPSPPPYPETYHSPFHGHRYKIPFIILSSLLGIVIGDCAELEALRLIGARRVLVVVTAKPFAAAILGNILLGEALYPAAFLGMMLTALGVYIVLMASLEKVEEIKEKKHRGSMKRKGDNDDMSFSSNSVYSDDEDGENAEIISIINEENNRIGMVGMHRRPLSRHDLRADVEELLGDDDNLMMLLEDGRGYIDTSIFCNLDKNNRSSSPNMRKWSSGSLGSTSFNSMGSLEDLNLDVNTAMENFGNDDADDYFFSHDMDPDSPPSKHFYDEKNTRNEASGLILSIPMLPKRSTSLKSVLKKTSRYNLKDNDTNATAISKERENSKTHTQREISRNMIDEKSLMLMDPSRKKRSRQSSQNSCASVDTECGPPPGLYGGGGRRETKVQRNVRLRTGYSLALINVFLDAYGSYLTKKHGFGMSTWEINLCRLGFAGGVMSAMSVVMQILDFRKKRRLMQTKNNEKVSRAHSRVSCVRPWYRLPHMASAPWVIVSVGVCFVTFFAPALSNFSLFEIPLALSVSLSSTTPLYTLPLGILLKGERPTRRGCFGAALSVFGAMILCVWGLDVESL